MTLLSRRLISLLVAAACSGIAAKPLNAAEDNGQASLNDGYSLFYDFCTQESQLSLLLWIKAAPPNIADYAKRISSTAKDDLAILKQFGVNDKALRLDKVSLPGFEITVRKSMADDRAKQLFWSGSKAAFAQDLSMTQSEATNYGLHVAKVLAATDSNPDRAQAMRLIVDKWIALHTEAYKLAQ